MTKKRCNCCNKRILMEFTCKCNGIYCLDCLDDKKHNCTFDYLENQKNILKQKLEKVVATKLQFV
jgi:hypothetical protein